MYANLSASGGHSGSIPKNLTSQEQEPNFGANPPFRNFWQQIFRVYWFCILDVNIAKLSGI